MATLVTYKLSKQAAEDLEDIFDFTAKEFGPDQAAKYLYELDEVFSQMIVNPEIGKARDEIRKGLRSFPKSSHVVFYRIRENYIWIVRVLHGSRDIPNFL